MKNIDFLPQDYKDARNRHRERIMRLWLVGAAVCALAVLFVVGHVQLRQARNDLSYLASQNQLLQRGLDLISQLTREQQQLSRKYKMLQALAPQVSCSENLTDLARLMPPGVTLKQYQLKCESPAGRTNSDQQSGSGSPQRYVVTVVGLAPSEMDVAVLVAQLSAFQRFRDVRLEYCKASPVHGRRAHGFKATFVIQPASLNVEQTQEVRQ